MKHERPTSHELPGHDLESSGRRWRLLFADDFDVDHPAGTARQGLSQRYVMYDEGSGDGKYRGDVTVSTHDGMLDIHLQQVDGVPSGAAGALVGDPEHPAFVGGRFAVRFRADETARGYGAAFLLWPASQVWGEGEIDFPEGEYSGGFSLNQHVVTPLDDASAHSLQVGELGRWHDWHVAVVEWLPGESVRYFVDGVLVADEQDPRNVPSTPHTWVVQTAADDDSRPPSPAAEGHLQLDWVAAWAIAG